jgi:hypothetical protein
VASPLALEPPITRRLRQATLALVALGTTGLTTELLLIHHYDNVNQLIPISLALLGLAVMAWVAVAPGTVAIRTFQLVMLLFAGAGVIGVSLHYQANAEFQREIDPSIGGSALFWKVVEATAPPALSPGVMVQLALLGLLYTYKHPAVPAEELDGDREER